MIKLERCGKPKELTEALEDELTQTYKETGKSVWDKSYIKKALLQFSHNKCCYCEAIIKEESKFMEVDHFYCKSLYPDKVVEWANLLPSCKKCNGQKRNHDVGEFPIINPTVDNPQDYLYFEDYRYKSKDKNTKGQKTINVLNLNDIDRLVTPRYEVGNKIHEKLKDIDKFLDSFSVNDNDVENGNYIVNAVRDLMKLALPEREYSAIVATTILKDYDFEVIRSKMTKYKLWSDELTELECKAKNICLLKHRAE